MQGTEASFELKYVLPNGSVNYEHLTLKMLNLKGPSLSFLLTVAVSISRENQQCLQEKVENWGGSGGESRERRERQREDPKNQDTQDFHLSPFPPLLSLHLPSPPLSPCKRAGGIHCLRARLLTLPLCCHTLAMCS